MNDHDSALLAVFLKSFHGQTLAGISPLHIFVGYSHIFLPSGIEDGGLQRGAPCGVGITLRGDVKTVFLRAFNHRDELRRVLQAHAGDVHDVNRSARRRGSGDDFLESG